MRKYGISNIPIIENDKIIEMVTERSLLHNEEAKTAEEAMVESCPIVSKETTIKIIKSLLDYCNLIAVQDKGKIVGIIASADLL